MEASAPAPAMATSRGASPSDRPLILVVGILVLVDFGSSIGLGNWSIAPLVPLTYYLGTIGFVTAGVISIGRSGQHANGRLMIGIAGAAAITDLLSLWPQLGPSGFLADIVTWFVYAMFAHLLLRWPDARLQSGPQRWSLWYAYVALPMIALAWHLTWDPVWFGEYAADWWWPRLAPAQDLSYGIWTVGQIGFLLLIVAVMLLIVRRVMVSVDRRSLLAVAISGGLLALSTLLGVAQGFGLLLGVDGNLLQNLALIAVPVAVIASAGAGKAARDPSIDAERAHHDAGGRSRHGELALRIGVALAAVIVVVGSVALGATVAQTPVDGVAVPQPVPGPGL